MSGNIDLKAIEHFVKIARQGANPASSGAEKIANRLAHALHRTGDDICRLDALAIRGLCDLIKCMAGPWPNERTKDGVYNAVRRAAK